MRRFATGFAVGCAAASVVALSLSWLAGPRPAKMLGHLRYPVAPARGLVAIDRDGEVLMQPAAAHAFQALTLAAQAQGVSLVAISGFRTLDKQKKLFFNDAAAKGETVTKRALTCAPPGFSEHHTGYTVDVADATRQDTLLDLRFKDTDGFRWLQQNAARFHFEMSFPPGNPQRVAYEPWHWRYVGDLQSFRTFYYARFGQR